MANITYHGEQRVKDRIGLSKKKSNDIAEKALQFGITHSEAKGSLKRYFDKLFFKNRAANNIRIYHEKVFIFNNNTLVTVIDLPNNLKKTALKISKSKAN